MSTKLHEEIINIYKKLYETKEGHDTIIYAGEKEFHTHSFILKTQSEFFKKAFVTDDVIEKKDGYFILNSSKSPNVFEILLRYMYCEDVYYFREFKSREILDLLLPLEEFKLQPLIIYFQEALINDHYNFIIENILEIIELTYQKDFLDKLWNFCIQKICYKPDYLFTTTKFLTLNPAILEIILKRDDFYIKNEIIIWEILLKWACKQHPVVQQNVSKWDKNEFTVMERRLNRFIPLFRFYHMSSEDFLLKVYPFKELLPDGLVYSILLYHMVPSNRLNTMELPRFYFYSDIINPQHLTIFSSWIDKKETLHYNKAGYHIPYRFNLLYRASRDGNTVASFHEKCDNKGATIVIAKIKQSEQIIGGYNPLQWDSSNSYKSAKNSFVFSFTYRTDFQSARVGYINNGGQNSIYCGSDYGPTFGTGFDLYCQSDNITWSSHNLTYDHIDIPTSSNVKDYEVFQVIKST